MNGKLDLAASRVRRSSLRLLTLMLIAVSAAYFAIERGEQTMTENAVASVFSAPKPLIDIIVPKQVDTATFAMG
jgi:hypothetical protein